MESQSKCELSKSSLTRAGLVNTDFTTDNNIQCVQLIGRKKALQAKMMIRKFYKAKKQAELLGDSLEMLRCRYERASRDNVHNMKYSLGMRLSTTEGVRLAYCAYKQQLGEKILKLQQEMRDMGLLVPRQGNRM